jgi:hypothetical protein
MSGFHPLRTLAAFVCFRPKPPYRSPSNFSLGSGNAPGGHCRTTRELFPDLSFADRCLEVYADAARRFPRDHSFCDNRSTVDGHPSSKQNGRRSLELRASTRNVR